MMPLGEEEGNSIIYLHLKQTSSTLASYLRAVNNYLMNLTKLILGQPGLCEVPMWRKNVLYIVPFLLPVLQRI